MPAPPQAPTMLRLASLVGFMWGAYFLNYSDRQAVFAMFKPLSNDLAMTDQQLGLTGEETFDIPFENLVPRTTVVVKATRPDGTVKDIPCMVRIDTPVELDQFRSGGILPFVLRQLIAEAK